MNKSINYLLAGFLGFAMLSCDNDDENGVQDMEAPVIEFADGRDGFRPAKNEIRRATTDHMHVRFSVRDESGLGEVRVNVHNGFDGHTHGRVNNSDFVPMSVNDIYAPDADRPTFRFPEGATRMNVDDTSTDIYWEGPTSRIGDDNILAGPYHFSVSATDIFGNSTSYGDGSNYNTTFYIRRAYAPAIAVTNMIDDELEGEGGETLNVTGSITKTDHALSSDITFVWVRLVDEDHDHDHDHSRVQDSMQELVWGESAWRNETFSNVMELPSTSEIDLAVALGGDNSIILPNEHGHYELLIWVEDANGNITKEIVKVHVD
ncbi:MAG: DUF4625 domain-containing protein [Cyclobacteriaceae bacterium]|nr:DUF4625 domain-containing protein [Cyclobacteriaceae bacterium]MCH8517618.1 DUF4625 domain-containing protein [Cyclobacteriaceae bacterium]